MSTSPPAEPVVRLRQLRKRFGARQALAGIDLDLAPGQITGIVGPDGAGKTTLIRSLAGLLEVEADEARVLGFDLRRDVTELKALIGYIPQAFGLQRDLSVLENLRFTARLHRLTEEERETRVRELLERVGLAPFADRPAGALSGGMKQKLAVANALLPRPLLLLLDEPTAGVDVVARGEIWSQLEQERSRALVVISTSYLDEAARCDRLVYLDEGRVVATGTPAELRSLAAIDVYRAWSVDPRSAARQAHALPYVRETRAGARFARVEVAHGEGPGDERVVRDLSTLEGTLLAEHTTGDMESTLLALARPTEKTSQVPGPRSQVSDSESGSDSIRGPGTWDLGLGTRPSRSGTDAIIETRGLTKKFGDFTAVDALDIRVLPGTIFAFLGANGSGKSTTIRMLIGLLEPTTGTIQVDGIDVIHHPRRVRDHIGYMGQKVSLYQGLSLRENVEFYAGLYGLSARDLERSWGALRERFSLGEVESEKSEELPAGIRQRAGLALSTLHNPRLLFLDEPTAGVDVHNRNLFWELIQDEARAGVTVFVTTHFLEEVDYCDWVSFIDQGRLIADAEPEALRREYSQGYDVEIDVPRHAAARAAEGLRRLGHPVQADGLGEAEPSHGGLWLLAPVLDDGLLSELGRLSRELGARVRIAQPEMTDVFRRVLTQAAARRTQTAREAA